VVFGQTDGGEDRTDEGRQLGLADADGFLGHVFYLLFISLARCLSFVMPGLVPGIHASLFCEARRGWPDKARP